MNQLTLLRATYVSPHLQWCRILPIFGSLAILKMKNDIYKIVVLICTSLIMNENEYLFKCLKVLEFSSLQCPVFIHFSICLLALFLICRSSLYIKEFCPLCLNELQHFLPVCHFAFRLCLGYLLLFYHADSFTFTSLNSSIFKLLSSCMETQNSLYIK